MGRERCHLIWLMLLLTCLSGCLGKGHMPKPASGDYEGRVSDALTGVAIPGVNVTIGTEYTTTTGLNGEFVFSMLTPGDYQVTLKRAWYQEAGFKSKHVGKDVRWDFELQPETIDGGLIYYADSGDYQNELYYLNLATRQVIPLLQTVDSETEPIVFNGAVLYDSDVNQTATNGTDIYRFVPGSGSQPERLFPSLSNSGHPSMSADGKKLVFHSKQDETWYVMLQTDGAEPQRLVAGQRPVINPEGTRVAYLSGYSLYIYNLETGVSQRCNFSGKINHPSWHPVIAGDGSWKMLVEAWTDSGGRHRIYLITSDAPDLLHPVTYTYGGNEDEDHRHPCWSADGSIFFFSANILFSSRRDLYCLRLSDVLTSGEAAPWILVSPGSGSKNNPNWAGGL